MKENNNTNLLLFLIAIPVIISVTLVGGIVFETEDPTEPEVESIKFTEVSEDQQTITGVTYQDTNAVISGTITGPENGKVIVEKIRVQDNGIETFISVESNETYQEDKRERYEYNISVSKASDMNIRSVYHNKNNQDKLVYDKDVLSVEDANIKLLRTTSDTENSNKVNIKNNKVTIEGNIVGSTSGKKPIIEGYSMKGDTLEVNIGLYKPPEDVVYLPVVTGYNYVAEIDGVSPDNVNVNHNSNYIEDLNSKDDVDSDIKLVESRSSTDFGNNYDFDIQDNKVTLEGSIVGSMGGMSPTIQDYRIDNKVLHVNIGLSMPENGIGTTAITQYDYKAVFDGLSVNDVVVNYNNNIEQYKAEKSKIEINNLGYSDRLVDSAKAEFNKNSATISGSIIGKTSGQEVFISDTKLQNGKYFIEIDTKIQKDNIVVADVLRSYSYELHIENINSHSSINLIHKDSETYEFNKKKNSKR